MTLFSRGQLTGWAAAASAVLAVMTVLGAPARAADDLPVVGDIHIPMPRILDDEGGPLSPDEGRYIERSYEERPYPQRPHAGTYRPGPYGSGASVAIPSVRNLRSAPSARPMLPPEQVVTVLRSSGYSPLGRVTQRGWIYTIAAIDRHGDDGRLIIDARTGEIIRFIPAEAVDERAMAVYGPPAPPPAVYAGYENRRGALLDLRNTPRPPGSVPKAARRPAPKAAGRNAPPSETVSTPPAAAPAQQAAAPVTEPAAAAKPAVAETRPAAATVGAAGPSAAAPSTLKLWPTQAMPDVQPLE